MREFPDPWAINLTPRRGFSIFHAGGLRFPRWVGEFRRHVACARAYTHTHTHTHTHTRARAFAASQRRTRGVSLILRAAAAAAAATGPGKWIDSAVSDFSALLFSLFAVLCSSLFSLSLARSFGQGFFPARKGNFMAWEHPFFPPTADADRDSSFISCTRAREAARDWVALRMKCIYSRNRYTRPSVIAFSFTLAPSPLSLSLSLSCSLSFPLDLSLSRSFLDNYLRNMTAGSLITELLITSV